MINTILNLKTEDFYYIIHPLIYFLVGFLLFSMAKKYAIEITIKERLKGESKKVEMYVWGSIIPLFLTGFHRNQNINYVVDIIRNFLFLSVPIQVGFLRGIKYIKNLTEDEIKKYRQLD